MDILHPKIWAGFTVLEAWLAGVHYADVIEVLPEWGSRRQIRGSDKLDEVVLEEVLAHKDLWVVESELLNALNSLALVVGVLWDEGLGCDVEAQKLGVDCVEDGWDQRGDERGGGSEGCAVGFGELEKGGHVLDAGWEVLQGVGGDVLHGVFHWAGHCGGWFGLDSGCRVMVWQGIWRGNF